jgi:hypothetical protein
MHSAKWGPTLNSTLQGLCFALEGIRVSKEAHPFPDGHVKKLDTDFTRPFRSNNNTIVMPFLVTVVGQVSTCTSRSEVPT